MLSADPCSQRYKPFSYSISSHTYCFYFSCECLCVFRMSFAVSRRPGNLSAPRSSEPPNAPTNQSTLGSQGGGGRSSNKPFRTESEYTYFTEMLYEKPMWFWKIAQYKSILVYLNNGIMIRRNGHDMGPLICVPGDSQSVRKYNPLSFTIWPYNILFKYSIIGEL